MHNVKIVGRCDSGFHPVGGKGVKLPLLAASLPINLEVATPSETTRDHAPQPGTGSHFSGGASPPSLTFCSSLCVCKRITFILYSGYYTIARVYTFLFPSLIAHIGVGFMTMFLHLFQT